MLCVIFLKAVSWMQSCTASAGLAEENCFCLWHPRFTQVLIPRLGLVAQPNLWHLTGLKILWSKYLIGISHPCWQVNVLLQSTKAIRLTGDVAGMWLRAIRWVSQMSSKLLRVNHTCATVYSVQSTWLSSSCCWNVLAELFMSELTWPVWLADNFASWLLLSVCLSILIRINWV